MILILIAVGIVLAWLYEKKMFKLIRKVNTNFRDGSYGQGDEALRKKDLIVWGIYAAILVLFVILGSDMKQNWSPSSRS